MQSIWSREARDDMDTENTLLVIAEIAIAFTGFAGIVGALAGERLKPNHPSLWLPFWAMVEFGPGTLFAALLPMLPYYLGAADRVTWAVSSGAVAVFLVCHLLFMTPRFYRAQLGEAFVRVLPLEIPISASIVFALISQLLNAFGIGLRQNAGGFLIGLYLLLLCSGLNFAYLIYVLVRGDHKAPAS